MQLVIYRPFLVHTWHITVLIQELVEVLLPAVPAKRELREGNQIIPREDGAPEGLTGATPVMSPAQVA